MSGWKVFYRDDHRRDAQSTHTSKAAAIAQALHLERRQHSRIQIIEGQNGELIDRETFEREYLRRQRAAKELATTAKQTANRLVTIQECRRGHLILPVLDLRQVT
jgi:hypothetical protein